MAICLIARQNGSPISAQVHPLPVNLHYLVTPTTRGPSDEQILLSWVL
jgi:hypothetical protein